MKKPQFAVFSHLTYSIESRIGRLSRLALKARDGRGVDDHPALVRGEGLVFATAKGTPLEAQNIVNRHFKPLLKRAGLPDIRWHDLRHTCATLLLSRGTHPTLVQHLLGHASMTMTLDRYSHWILSMGKQTASAMDAALAEEKLEDGEEAL